MNRDEEMFKLEGQDARSSWLGMAHELKIGADVILPELETVIRIRQNARPFTPELMQRQLALTRAYMMLVGFAFENLLKGIEIAKHPEYVDNKALDMKRLNPFLSGHGLVDLAKQHPGITAAELGFLERAETYTYWSGKYAIPPKSSVYSQRKDMRTYWTTDPGLVEELFAKLEALLEQEWATSSANR